MHQLRENTGNGLISELAQTPHCSVVTACHYHKHRLTLVHAHTSSHKLPCNCAYISTHNSKYRIHLKYVHASFPYLSILSLPVSFSRHYGTQCCCAVIISSCSSFLNLFYPLSNSGTNTGTTHLCRVAVFLQGSRRRKTAAVMWAIKLVCFLQT